MTCDCYYCKTHRLISKAKHNNDIDLLYRLAKELGGLAISAEADNDYHKCIMDGSWPTSVEILERALKNAKENQDENS